MNSTLWYSDSIVGVVVLLVRQCQIFWTSPIEIMYFSWSQWNEGQERAHVSVIFYANSQYKTIRKLEMSEVTTSNWRLAKLAELQHVHNYLHTHVWKVELQMMGNVKNMTLWFRTSNKIFVWTMFDIIQIKLNCVGDAKPCQHLPVNHNRI